MIIGAHVGSHMYSLIQKNGYTFAPYTVANVKPGFFESDVKYRAVCILLIIVVRDKKDVP